MEPENGPLEGKGRFLLETVIFRFHVGFCECNKVFLQDQKIRELMVAPDLCPSLL